VVVVARGETELARWELADPGRFDLDLVDQLARLQLDAQRAGCSITVHHPCPELCALLDLAGLTEVLVGTAALRVEVSGQTERGEQRGVDEVVVPDDPVA
jgi:hypothetical protein